MTTAQFFEKFDLFAGAPEAIPRMRRFILDLAVRGRLVAQDPKDEPASTLLERVQAEKARLIDSGEIKKQVQLPPVTDDAIPFRLPEGWAASQLGDIAICLDYMREPINGTERAARIAGKAKSKLFPYYGATQQQGWIDDYIFDTELVLLGEDGVPFFDDLRSKAYLISGKTWVNNHAHVFHGILVSNSFLVHWLNTFDYAGRVAGSTRSKLNQAKAVDIPIPVPPLAEQKRIVAKVDELMTLCEQLEAQQQERETKHTALAQAMLARFAEAPTPTNLNLLFHYSFSIQPSDLRKTILTLAVQGKLVPQDPNDEPATRRSSADSPFEIPSSWGWMPLGSLGLCRTGRTPPTNDPMNYGAGFPFVGPGQITTSGTFLSPEKTITHKGLSNSTESKPNDILMVCIGGSIGKTAICREALGFNQQINSIRPSTSLTDYLYLALTSGYFQQEVLARATGSATPIINKGKWEQILVPVPPLAEQKRIVAKVEELMALVDALEAQQAAADQAATHLLDAIVSELAAAA